MAYKEYKSVNDEEYKAIRDSIIDRGYYDAVKVEFRWGKGGSENKTLILGVTEKQKKYPCFPFYRKCKTDEISYPFAIFVYDQFNDLEAVKVYLHMADEEGYYWSKQQWKSLSLIFWNVKNTPLFAKCLFNRIEIEGYGLVYENVLEKIIKEFDSLKTKIKNRDEISIEKMDFEHHREEYRQLIEECDASEVDLY